jgi:hypothetical protein
MRGVHKEERLLSEPCANFIMILTSIKCLTDALRRDFCGSRDSSHDADGLQVSAPKNEACL